jgi:cell division initiation protein
MRVTPLDIRKQEFRKGMRGLDSDEVYAFLNTVADEYEAVLSDNKNLREKLVELESRLNEYRSIETNLRNTLVTAEKLTQEAKENAKREAALLIREAEMEAEKAAEAIRAHTTQLRREILELKKNKDNYVTRLKTLLDSHRKMLEGFQEDFAGVDQAIEKIGQQVEDDARKTPTPPRMSREKITQEFAREPKDKVTWGEERRREDEQRPAMPKPGWETHESPNQRTKPAEDANLFAAPGGTPGPSAAPQDNWSTQHLKTEPIGGVSQVRSDAGPRPAQAMEEPPQSPHGAPNEAPPNNNLRRTVARSIEQNLYPDVNMDQQPGAAAAPRQQRPDDWKQYEVRKEPTDWRSYEIAGQRVPQKPRPPVADDREVESALSGLKEASDAAPQAAPGKGTAQMTVPRPTPAQPQPPSQQTAQGVQQPRPAEPASAEADGESPWSLEELRRNLTNLSKNEGDQG